MVFVAKCNRLIHYTLCKIIVLQMIAKFFYDDSALFFMTILTSIVCLGD